LLSKEARFNLGMELGFTGTFVFDFAGWLLDRKGVKELLKAFFLLLADHPNIRLLMVGPIEAKQLFDASLIGKMGSHPAVVLAGLQRNVPFYLSLMDVFVLPCMVGRLQKCNNSGSCYGNSRNFNQCHWYKRCLGRRI